MADEKIISKEKITASVVNDLLTAIKKLYSNRNLTITEGSTSRNLKTINDNYNKTISMGNIIKQSDLGDILDKVLIINDQPNLLSSAYGQNILADGITATNDILNWVNTYKGKTSSSHDLSTHGCRGACIGLCYNGCYGDEYGSAGSNRNDVDYQTGCSECGGACVSGCYQTCSGQTSNGFYNNCNSCEAACEVTCYQSCYGCTGCDNLCKDGCRGNCNGCGHNCSKACKLGCGETCETQCGANVCSSGCYNKCEGVCQATCKDGCAWDCKNGCYGTVKNNTYT